MTADWPTLARSDVLLRPISLADAPAWFVYAGDPEVMRHTSATPTSAQELQARIELALSDAPGSLTLFALCRRDDPGLIGTVGFHSISLAHRSAEISYEVHPAHAGQGLASAMCAAALDWGHTQRGFVRIQATVQESNLASLAVLRRCGFVAEGRLRGLRMVRGEARDYLVFSHLPGDVKPAASSARG